MGSSGHIVYCHLRVMCFISGPSSKPFIPYGMALTQKPRSLGWGFFYLFAINSAQHFSHHEYSYIIGSIARAACIVPWSCCRTFSSGSGPSDSQSWQPFVSLGNWAGAIYFQIRVYCLQNLNRPTMHYAFFLVMEGTWDIVAVGEDNNA